MTLLRQSRNAITLTLSMAFALKANGQSVTPNTFLRIETGGHTSQVTAVAFGPDGKLLTASRDKTVRRWDVPQGRLGSTIRYPIHPGPGGWANSMAIAADGTMAIASYGVGAPDNLATVYLYAVGSSTPKPITGLPLIASLALTKDGSKLAILDGSGTLGLYDAHSGTLKKSCQIAETKTPRVSSLDFSPDGKSLVYATNVGTGSSVSLLRTEDLSPLASTTADRLIQSVSFGRETIYVSGIHLLGRWDRTGALKEFPFTESISNGVVTAADGGAYVLSSDSLNTSRLEKWSSAGKREAASEPFATPATSIGISERQELAVGFATGPVAVVTSDLKVKAILEGSGSPFGEVAWSPDGSVIAWGATLGEGRRQPKLSDFKAAFGFTQLGVCPVPGDLVTSPKPKLEATYQNHSHDLVISSAGGHKVTLSAARAGEEIFAYSILDASHVVISTSSKGVALFDISSDSGPVSLGRLSGADGLILGLSLSPDGRFLAGTGADQTIRIWNAQELCSTKAPGEFYPKLSLFPGSDGEWVLWNDEKCFYAASAKGDSVLGLHTNLDEQRVDFRSAFTRRETYYKPGVIRSIFASGQLPTEAASVASMTETQKECPTATVIDVVGAKAVGNRYVTELATVKIVLRVDKEVSSVSIAERNATAKGLVPIRGANPTERIVEAHLIPGINRVKLVAKNKFGESAPVFQEIEYKSAQPIPSTLRVFAVGVSAYNSRDVSELPSDTDVSSIAKFYESQGKSGKLGAVSVTSVTEKTTKAEILELFRQFLKTVTPGDDVILYVSAHGAPGTRDNTKFYFLPKDVDPNNIDDTAVSWQSIIDQMAGVDCRCVAVVQDTCYSGGAKFALLDQVARDSVGRKATETNIILLSSSQANQVSYALPDTRRSIFTMAFLNCLQGSYPYAVKNGFIWLNRFSTPLKDEVQKLIEQYKLGAVQTPHVININDADMRLAAVGANP